MGAGERTPYVPLNLNDERYIDGFPVLRDTFLVTFDQELQPVSTGTRVYFTYPAELFRGTEIGQDNNSIYACASLIGISNPMGWIKICHVQKPPKVQNRTINGMKAQDFVASTVLSQYPGSLISIAKQGALDPDVVLEINGERIQIEVKSTGSIGSELTFFDKSVARHKPIPLIIDEISLVLSNGSMNFLQVLEYYRTNHSRLYGLAGDTDSYRSGKLPQDFFKTINRVHLEKLSSVIRSKLIYSGDNYFAIIDRLQSVVYMYHTGLGTNILQKSDLPKLKSFNLATYGGPSNGCTRIGLKVKLDAHPREANSIM